MNRTLKIWLIAAISMILIGGIIFVITLKSLHWDFTKLSTVKYETNIYEICEDFRDISICTSTADIQFLPSEDDSCEITCYEAEKRIHSVSVKGGVLTIDEVDTRKWYDYIEFFSFQSPKITIRLPQDVYGDLTTKQSTGDLRLTQNITFNNVSITTSTGDILLTDVSADEMKISVTTGRIKVHAVTCQEDLSIAVSTGKTELTDVTCRTFHSNGNTGNISLKNVVASGECCIERSTGDVVFDRCDAAEISITTDTGDVKGTLLSDKVFIARTDTGRVNVPETTIGGKCKITTSTGDIIFE